MLYQLMHGLLEDQRFTTLADRISLQIFRINSNVKGIESLVKQLGSRHDNADIRSKLCAADQMDSESPWLMSTTGTIYQMRRKI